MLPEIYNEVVEPENEIILEDELPLLREYAWDFTNNNFIYLEGKLLIVEGKDAIKIHVFKMLNTERFKYMGYSWDYGHELDLVGNLLTPDAAESEVHRLLNECLLSSPYIKSVRTQNVKVEGKKITYKANILTVYGEVSI